MSVKAEPSSDTAVVIPAYNEEATIRDVAERALAQLPWVIVVDDGSTDGTVEKLQGLPVVLLRNEHNSGKAATLSHGLNCAVSDGARAVITLDGDGQHRPEDIPSLLATARRHPDALAIAARLLDIENAPKARLFANRFADFWISWAGGRWVQDSQSGFRLYPAKLIEAVTINHDRTHGFVFESEIIIEALRQGFGCEATPIASIYRHGARKSHFRPVADITRIVLMVAGKLFRWGFYPRGLWQALKTRPR
ncbi:glycosyltransferase family 2 protein [Thiohalomonas denitrificans]|uniref:glycosyltransferase family 2 protein n=1 Tax=Thiohalomonas denitrificans TaxID=415747 RepID=UPI0026F19D90|nr:glycosyltransferase family 2 protein [Thiohalomonas denitrificans]